ncbi:MAG: F0F1 ATP synthase subunit A [Leptospiraceae bacterium]|nr:F0F1 ATP synthase subunit A [Leptospiraceae bacterium]
MDSVIFELHIGGEKVRPGHPDFNDTQFLKRYTFKDETGLYRYAGGIPLHVTRRVAMMGVVSLLLLIIMIVGARRIASNPHRVQGRFANGLEAMVQWVRYDVADPAMDGHSKGFQPYILTLFFFILFGNIAGLFPPIGEAVLKIQEAFSGHHAGGHGPGSTSPAILAIWPGMTITGDISVNLALALIATLMIWVTGFRYQGFKFLWHSVPNGVPLFLYPIMWVLEFIVSPLAKGFALTVRLLANMTGGHVVILALVGFIFQAKALWFAGVFGVIGGVGITMASVAGAVAIYFLEILVAFLQAFIFAMLTSLFIGSVMHRH